MKKSKISKKIYVIIALMISLIVVSFIYFGISKSHTEIDSEIKEPLTKELFYNISPEKALDLEVNKEYISDTSILTSSKELIKRINNTPMDLNKYYFVNINGQIKDEYIKASVKLYTYKDNKLLEEFELGIDSLYNVIYISQDYEYIRMEVTYSGKGKIKIDNISISEILEFKELDISTVEFDDTYIYDFEMAQDMYNIGFSISNEQDILNNLEVNKIVYEVNEVCIKVEKEDLKKGQELISEKREELLRVNGFSNCVAYLKLYTNTKNDEIIYKYYDLIEAWIDNYKYTSNENGLVYNDMSTAYRVYNWIRFYHVAEEYLNQEQKTKFLTSIIYQANLLEETHFNSRGTNHGLYQDISNLFYLKTINSKYNLEEQIIGTTGNIEKYFEECVSKNGIHLEHSPDYHIFMMEGMEDLIKIFVNLKIDTTKLQDKLDKMQEFLIYIVKPDNELPQIGDTAKRKIELSEYIEKTKLNNISNLPIDVVYEDEGYAIFRKDWEDDTYILFYNAYNSYYHKHSDENGLWIYRDGDIIREAGKNGYTYNDPFTKYAYSSWGHNTLIVNGKGLVEEKNIPNDYNYTGTYIKDFNITNSDSVWVTGINARYDNVTHERKVNYNKNEDIVYVSDCITSTDENVYTLLWNLSTDIIAKEDENCIRLYRNDELIMTIEFETEAEYSVEMVKGQTEPRILGWSTNLGKVEETTTIKLDFEKQKDVKILTKFIFEK